LSYRSRQERGQDDDARCDHQDADGAQRHVVIVQRLAEREGSEREAIAAELRLPKWKLQRDLRELAKR